MARAIALLFLIVFSASSARVARQLEVSFWYWHTPFLLSKDDTRQLEEIGVKKLFVRAGTFSHEFKLMAPQEWQCAGAPFTVDLVYNFDSGLLRHFAELDARYAAVCMADAINRTAAAAKRKGVKVSGIQLDIDCPTRLLRKYADLVARIRPLIELDEPWKLSVTGLSSWLGTSGFQYLAEKVDFLAPQFYESDIAFNADQVRPIGDVRAIERGLPKAGALDKPVYAGIATYGRALLYDSHGRLAGIYRGLSPESALRHPFLNFDGYLPLSEAGFAKNQIEYEGEDQLRFVATGPGPEARGYRLVYDLPTPTLFKKELQAVIENAPDNCQGIILYRMPQDEDGLALLLPSIDSVLRGKQPSPQIKLDVVAKPDPWRLVDSNGSEHSAEIKVEAMNAGDGPTAIGPHAIQVLARWPDTGMIQAEPGGFDSLQPGRCDSQGAFEPCLPAEANAVLLTKCRLLPGERCISGQIEVSGRAQTEAVCIAEAAGGFGTFKSHAYSMEEKK